MRCSRYSYVKLTGEGVVKNYLYRLNQNYDELPDPKRFWVFFIPLTITAVGDLVLSLSFDWIPGILMGILMFILGFGRMAYTAHWLDPKKPTKSKPL